MRVFTPLLFVLFTGSLQGQITIGQNEMPQSGSELVRNRANYPLFMNYAATGAGHNWTFNSLTVAAGNTTAYSSVSSTNLVYALVYSDVFFNPNRANHARAGLDIALSDLLPVEDPYTFFHRSSTAYKKVGYGLGLEGIPVPVIMGEHDVIYELPLNYGDNHVSSSHWELGLPTLAFYGYRQVRENTVDGWGTLTIPSGTFDVLRVKTRIEGHDTINVDTLSLGFTIDRPVVHEYKWLAQGIRVPVLQVNTVELLGAEVITEVFFYDVPRNITVDEPLADMLCPGGATMVDFTAEGMFNPPAFLVQGNSFRVQLSDATGSFANPTVIGSVNGTASGSVNVTIPANTPTGTGYRVRMVSTNPAFVGPDNGYDLVVGTTPEALATASGPTSICEGGQVTLHAEEAMGASYQWHDANGPIPGANDPDLMATTSGAYQVMLTNACGSSMSAPVDVTVTPLPEHTIAVGTPAVICADASLLINAVDNSGQSGLSYAWFLDEDAIAGADGLSVNATGAGVYTLEVTNAAGCMHAVSHTVLLDPIVGSVPSVTADGPISLCAGSSVTLAHEGNTNTVQWYVDGFAIPNADGNELTVSASGEYHIVLTSAAGCSSLPSNTMAVVVHDLPAPPVVTQEGHVLAASGSGSFQWSFGGEAIEGATGATHTATADGTYSVTVTDVNGCSSTSDGFLFSTVGVTEQASMAFRVWPNPTDGLVRVQLDRPVGNAFHTVMDATGRTIMQGAITGPSATIDLQQMPVGLYLITVQLGDQRHTARVVRR